jgi:trehalose utilization protein
MIMQRREFLGTVGALGLASVARGQGSKDREVNVVVWDEQQPKQKLAYENFLGNAIADHLRARGGFQVTSAKLDDPEQGLSAATLDKADVLIWWGHVRHPEVKPETGRAIVERIKAGKLSLIALHSAHWSTPFKEAMYARAIDDALASLPEADRKSAKVETIEPRPFTVPKRDDPQTPSTEVRKTADGVVVTVTLPNCVFPAYREDGKPSHVRVLLPDHPIAAGLPKQFDIPRTEMYDAPFHVPKPDAILFEERGDAGEHFPSGCLWTLGKGHVFYFRPGHESYPVYKQAEPLRVVENAARWLGGKKS